MNKKGIAITGTITLGMVIVAGIVVLLALLGVGIFASINLYSLIGAGLIVLTLVYVIPAAISGDFTRQKMFFVLFLVGVGVFIIFLPKTGLIEQAVIGNDCIGGQVLSVDSARIMYSPELNKKVIRVLFSTLQSAECLDIQISKNVLQDKINDNNFQVDKGITGDIWLTKKAKEYNIAEKQTEKFLKFGVSKFDASPLLTFCSDSECVNRYASINDNNIISSIDMNNQMCGCIYETETGIGGDFLSSEGLLWEANVKIGDQNPLVLSESKLSGTIGNIAFVKWAGNLGSNDNLGSIDKDVYKPYSNNQFRMIDSGTYTTLKNQYNTLYNDLVACGELGIENEQCVLDAEAYNSLFDDETNNQINSWANTETLVDSASFSSNKLIVNLKSAITYPIFTLDIAAEEVGIFLTGGKPEVNCPEDFDMTSGDLEEQTISIKNIASTSGSFEYSVDCNEKGSQVLQPSPPQSVSAGQTLSVTGSFGLTVEEGSQEAECSFTAKDLNTQQTDTCSFKYTSVKQTKCLEGTTSCEAGNSELWLCLEDGSYNKTSCPNGCQTLSEGESKCKSTTSKEPSQNELTCLAKNEENQNRYEWVEKETETGALFWKKTVDESYCKDNYKVYYILAGVGFFLLLITIIVILTTPKKNAKKKKKK